MTEMLKRLKKEEKFANYSGSTDMGKLGIERYYEEQLHGTTGLKKWKSITAGKLSVNYVSNQPQRVKVFI